MVFMKYTERRFQSFTLLVFGTIWNDFSWSLLGFLLTVCLHSRTMDIIKVTSHWKEE